MRKRDHKPARPGCYIEYLKRKEMYQRVTFTICPDGNSFYLVGGIEVSEGDFRAMYPIGSFDKSATGIRLDSRQNLY